jgi:hypothetical protein
VRVDVEMTRLVPKAWTRWGVRISVPESVDYGRRSLVVVDRLRYSNAEGVAFTLRAEDPDRRSALSIGEAVCEWRRARIEIADAVLKARDTAIDPLARTAKHNGKAEAPWRQALSLRGGWKMRATRAELKARTWRDGVCAHTKATR